MNQSAQNVRTRVTVAQKSSIHHKERKMMRRLCLVGLFVLILSAGILPVFASDSEPSRSYVDLLHRNTKPNAGLLEASSLITVYVKLGYTGNEDGKETTPYNTEKEGVALAQSSLGGAYVQVTDAAGKTNTYFVKYVSTGQQGAALPRELLYLLLAALAVLLVVGGWWLRRRSRSAVH